VSGVVGRRQVLAGAGALAVLGCAGHELGRGRSGPLYGLIGKITAKSGQRSALIGALSAGSDRMPGNLAYVIAEDAADADTIWVTEVWDSEASHRASLQLPGVREAIRRGRPLIAGFETVATTRVVAGAAA
jgi:quinol monooxygenase YgiN